MYKRAGASIVCLFSITDLQNVKKENVEKYWKVMLMVSNSRTSTKKLAVLCYTGIEFVKMREITKWSSLIASCQAADAIVKNLI